LSSSFDIDVVVVCHDDAVSAAKPFDAVRSQGTDSLLASRRQTATREKGESGKKIESFFNQSLDFK
jgi:hypothetical protein